MSLSDNTLEQMVLVLRRAYFASSVIRAIVFSIQEKESLYAHIYETQYLSVIIDTCKLFDKTGINLNKLLKSYKSKIQNENYQSYQKRIIYIENKHEKVIKKMIFHRNELVAHIGINKLKGVIEKQNIELNDIEDLLRNVVELFCSFNFVSTQHKNYIQSRPGPKDVQDMLHIRMKPSVESGFFEYYKERAIKKQL